MAGRNPYSTDSNPYDYEYQPQFGSPSGTAGYVNNRQIPPPAPLPTAGLESEAVRIKAQELARREAELERREKSIKEREEVVGPTELKNWPRCKPLIYFDINAACPEGPRRQLAKAGYLAWIVYSALACLNFIIALITVFLPKTTTTTDDMGPLGKAKFVIVAALWVVLGVPANFLLSHWPLYKAMSSAAVTRFTLFFFAQGCAIIFAAMMVAGWYEYGACGVIVAILYFPGSGNIIAFILNILMAALWGILLAWDIYIIIQGWRLFRAEKHTIESAKNTLVSSVTSQATSLAGAAVTAGVRHQMV